MRNLMELRTGLAAGLALALVAIGTVGLPAQAGKKAMKALEAAVANPARLEDDTKRDAARKPAKVLAFFGVEPGMTVLDVNSGAGYYSVILSGAVGQKGKVYAHNDDLYWPFAESRIGTRYEGLKNLTQVQANLPTLPIPENSVDIATFVLAYHDFYFTPKNRPQAEDPMPALAGIKKVLKPGGILAIVDHVAKPGSPPETGNTLHRIDPALLKKQVEAAGFVFDGESDVLRNPEDDHTQNVFAEGLRGQTDRFVYRFKKPE